jgi:hypothetical protein
MNRLFISLDGDNAGRHIGEAVLMDDVQKLHDTSKKIEAGNRAVEDMILSLGGQIVTSGGDELTAILDPKYESKIEEIRRKYEEASGFPASLGFGNTLSQAGKALIAAKLTGKNKSLKYNNSVEDIINEAHQAALEGRADEEQKKMDEHYIHAIKENNEDSLDQEDIPQSDDENPEFYEESPEDMMQYPEGVIEDSLPEDKMVDDDIVPDGDIPLDLEQDQYDQYQDQYDQYQDQYDQYQDQYEDYQDQYDQYQDQYEDYQDQNEDYQDQTYEGEFPLELDLDENDENTEGEEKPSEFEQEPTISLEGEENILSEDEKDDKKDPETEKADPEMATEEDDIDADLADADVNEDILQRIAANLDAFKQNKDLMNQIKETKPELYTSILGLLQNMIELARMISPHVAPKDQDQEMIEVPSGEYSQENEKEGQERLPKQRG